MDEMLAETISFSESEFFAAESPKPREIGSGTVTKVLGKGGTAVVYEIWNPKLEIYRAVKLWRRIPSEKALHRFENEIKITAKLNHPNIVVIYSAGEWCGIPFIEMEKIEGLSLKSLLIKHVLLPEVIASAIALTICRALMYAHTHEYTIAEQSHIGVVHCDMKPANIMISKDGVIKLMDFGIAHPSTAIAQGENSRITGSLQYMSPEQLKSEVVDLRSDIYSLGVLLYELYSGVKAFPAESLPELVRMRNENDVTPLSDFCNNLPARIRIIIEKCMAFNPDARIQTVHEMFREINELFQKQTSLSPQVLITRFIRGEELEYVNDNHSIPGYLKTAGLALIPFIVFIIVFVIATRREVTPSKSNTSMFQNGSSLADQLSSTESGSVTESQSSHETSQIAKQALTNGGESEQSVNVKQQSEFRARQSTTVKKSGGGTVIGPVVSNSGDAGRNRVDNMSVLDKLKSLLADGNLNQAEILFKKVTLNDGEYHLLHAELLLRQNKWVDACKEADIALRMPAQRMAPVDTREKVLYLKALALTAEFDASKVPQKGREAMEVWFNIKYIYRVNPMHKKYRESDSTIRRISAEL